MEQIVDLRDRFASPEVYAVFRDCMFRPTPETFALKAHRWMEDPDVLLLGSSTSRASSPCAERAGTQASRALRSRPDCAGRASPAG